MSVKEMKPEAGREPRKPLSRLRATAAKAERNDVQALAPAHRSLGEGGKPPRLRRGAVETPPVQSVERALSLLEAVARSTEPGSASAKPCASRCAF